MFNKNGLLFANQASSYKGLFPYAPVDITGTEVILSQTSYGPYSIALLAPSSLANTNTCYYAKSASDISSVSGNAYLSCGYRETAPDENTFIPVFSDLTMTLSGSGSFYPVITLTNGTVNDITVNEVDISMSISASKVMFALFSFDTITLAPGDTFSFSILRK